MSSHCLSDGRQYSTVAGRIGIRLRINIFKFGTTWPTAGCHKSQDGRNARMHDWNSL